MEITELQKQEIIKLIDSIRNNVSGIVDYCNLNLEPPSVIDYSIKEYPINLIEHWAKEGKKQIDELEKIFKMNNDT